MVLDENATPRKLIAIDLNDEENILPASSVNARLVARKILKKCKQFNLQKTEFSLKILVNSFSKLLENFISDVH